MTRPAIKTQDHTITVLKIGEARGNFPQMVSSLESGSSGSFVIGRYGKPEEARQCRGTMEQSSLFASEGPPRMLRHARRRQSNGVFGSRPGD